MTPWEPAAATQEGMIRRLLEREEAERPDRGVALDLGCGTGGHTLTLAKRGWEAWGVDASAEAIRRARRRAAEQDALVRFDLGDVRHLDEIADPPMPVSLVVDVGCYHGIRPVDRQAVAAGLSRLAAPGATMLLVALYHQPSRLFPVGATADELRTVFRGWEVEETLPLDLSAMGGIVGRAPFVVVRLRRGPATGA